jgi:hypothetical protein
MQKEFMAVCPILLERSGLKTDPYKKCALIFLEKSPRVPL